MKQVFTFLFFLTTIMTKAQVTLDPKDLNNLIAISKLYSSNTNVSGVKFDKSIDSLRTPKLNHIADALIAVGKGDKTILEYRFLARPNDEELVLWYVIREIHYNRTNTKLTARPDKVVVEEILSKKIDNRWLLDNYYYRIHGGIASLFNDADLSKYNFDVDSLGFKDETEKSIFFLNMMDALVGGRFKVLQIMKNNKRYLTSATNSPHLIGRSTSTIKTLTTMTLSGLGTIKQNHTMKDI